MQEVLLTILTIITIIITGTMFYVGYKVYKLFLEETKKTIYRQMKNRK